MVDKDNKSRWNVPRIWIWGEPELGLHVFNCAFKSIQQKIGETNGT